MVVDLLCREWNCYLGGGGLREIEDLTGIQFHIHHIDFKKTNNSPGNLIMIDARLHNGHMNGFGNRSGYSNSVVGRHPVQEGGEEI